MFRTLLRRRRVLRLYWGVHQVGPWQFVTMTEHLHRPACPPRPQIWFWHGPNPPTDTFWVQHSRCQSTFSFLKETGDRSPSIHPSWLRSAIRSPMGFTIYSSGLEWLCKDLHLSVWGSHFSKLVLYQTAFWTKLTFFPLSLFSCVWWGKTYMAKPNILSVWSGQIFLLNLEPASG